MAVLTFSNGALARGLAGICASAALASLYIHDTGGLGWPLGFVAWVPWLLVLTQRTSMAGTLLCAYGMSLAYTATGFSWFGAAMGSFTQIGTVSGVSVLLLGAPLFQPQILVFACVRFWATRQLGSLGGSLVAVAAWVASEWLIPKVLSDTFGYGLYPSAELRQGAAWVGVTGLTALLLMSNECFARAIAGRSLGIFAAVRPFAFGLGMPILAAGIGFYVLQTAPAPSGKPLRMGLVQANIVDYERQRLEKGTHAVVLDVLNTHFAMSHDAIVRHHADAVLWSETVYPTTFGTPKSVEGAEMDREILNMVNAAKVPIVFGTYDRDAVGEYNAAAFVRPDVGLYGMYRKTRLFPLTESVPTWLDGPLLRRLMPWTGNWMPGTGARVFPLLLADGREIPVAPLICLDDVDAMLAIQGARLGAQALLTMSNDSWFTTQPQGAKLHLAVAAFRSIETGLPQFRVTTNGHSAVIDITGAVQVQAPMSARHLVVGEMPVPVPKPTLLVQWGDWVGQVCTAALLLWILGSALRWGTKNIPNGWASGSDLSHSGTRTQLNATVYVLPPLARLVAGALRAFARGSLLWMGAAMLMDGQLQSNTLAQIRLFATLFLAPELASWCVLWAFSAKATIAQNTLVMRRGSRSLQIPIPDIVAALPWRVPLPGPGLSFRLASGALWPYFIQLNNPAKFVHELAAAGGPAVQTSDVLLPPRLAHSFIKFLVFPTLLALAAFRLHQNIAYGGSLGQYYTFGLQAFATSFMLWWAAWFIGVTLCAAAVRAVIEVTTRLVALWRPAHTLTDRGLLERLGLVVLYAGMPGWLAMRALGS